VATPLLSIVIPTHKRVEILRRCLEHIAQQTVVDQIEVIVVSDGPDTETESMITELKSHVSHLTSRYFSVPKSQQGVARNRGVQEAKGKYVLFIGDDIFLAPNACEKHLEILNSQFLNSSIAVLGHTTWDPACDVTPVMRWLESSGWQFGYQQLTPNAFVDPLRQERFTYTSHISLPREIAKNFPFREDVTLYGWEDVEWGLRLKEAGTALFYAASATALHHHHMTLEDSLKRMETLGRSAVMMERLNPALGLVPRRWKLWKYRIASFLPNLRGAHARAFLKGISDTHAS
jgi:glycosyltransferase involved in cell wall biosynthesis